MTTSKKFINTFKSTASTHRYLKLGYLEAACGGMAESAYKAWLWYMYSTVIYLIYKCTNFFNHIH